MTSSFSKIRKLRIELLSLVLFLRRPLLVKKDEKVEDEVERTDAVGDGVGCTCKDPMLKLKSDDEEDEVPVDRRGECGNCCGIYLPWSERPSLSCMSSC